MSSCCGGCFGAFFRQKPQREGAQQSRTLRTLPSHESESPQTKIQEAAQLRNALRDDARHHFSGTSPLTKPEEDWMTDEVLGIYVRARPTPEERLAILVPALEWRMSNREVLASLECPYCVANPLSHDARLFGFDSEGDYIFMNCFELPHDISVDSVTRHMTCLLERALNEYPSSPNAPLEKDGHPKTRRWNFIFDLYGFGLRYYDPRVTMRLLELFQVVHRGRVKKLYVLDAPYVFWSFWQIVQPFMKAETAAKLEFSDWETMRPRFEEYFGVSLTAELSEEARENRDPQRVASKRWTTFYGSSMDQARRNRMAARAKPTRFSSRQDNYLPDSDYRQFDEIADVTANEDCAKLCFWPRLNPFSPNDERALGS